MVFVRGLPNIPLNIPSGSSLGLDSVPPNRLVSARERGIGVCG